MLSHPLIQNLLSLNLALEDFAVFGSGPMFAHGIKDLGGDLDLIARGRAWEKASVIKQPVAAKSGTGEVIELFDGLLEIFDIWGPGEWDVNRLIDDAEIIDGIRFVRLPEVLKWKKLMNRDKDMEHIRLIEEYLSSKF